MTTKYLGDGKIVKLIQKLDDDRFLVELFTEHPDTMGLLSGGYDVVSEVFDEPLDYAFELKIKRKREELTALEKLAEDLKAEVYVLRTNRDSLLDEKEKLK